MAKREILLLGDDRLYKISKDVTENEIDKARQITEDLEDTIIRFKEAYGFGRAIAAPQINEHYRIIYMRIDGESTVFINPEIEYYDEDIIEIWDDCMSFPGVEVKLERHKNCRVKYKDLSWKECTKEFSGDLSELIQHEYDHLDGILAVQRAIDNKSFRINKDKVGTF